MTFFPFYLSVELCNDIWDNLDSSLISKALELGLGFCGKLLDKVICKLEEKNLVVF